MRFKSDVVKDEGLPKDPSVNRGTVCSLLIFSQLETGLS